LMDASEVLVKLTAVTVEAKVAALLVASVSAAALLLNLSGVREIGCAVFVVMLRP